MTWLKITFTFFFKPFHLAFHVVQLNWIIFLFKNTRYLCHLDFILSVNHSSLPVSFWILRPGSRSFAQTQSRISFILCSVPIEMCLYIFNTICWCLATLFPPFLPQSRKCVSPLPAGTDVERVPHFSYIISS